MRDKLVISDKRVSLYAIACAFFIIIFGCSYPRYWDNSDFIAWLGRGSALILLILLAVKYKKLYIDARSGLAIATILVPGIITEYKPIDLISVVLFVFTFIQIANIFFDNPVCEDDTKNAPFFLTTIFVIGTMYHLLYSQIYCILFEREFFTDGFCFGWTDPLMNWIENRNTYYMYAFPMLAVFFAVVMNFKKHRLLTVLFVLLTGVSVVCFLMNSGGRTPLATLIIEVMFGIVLYIVYNRENKNLVKGFLRIVLPLVGAIVAIVLLFVILHRTGIIYLGDKVEAVLEFALNRDGGILQNDRIRWAGEVLRKLPEYPFGTNDPTVYDFEACHNMWFDLAKDSGIIPFVLMLVYTVITVYDVAYLVIKRTADGAMYYILPSMYLGFVLYASIERPFQISFMFLIPWICVNILVRRYNKAHREI